MFTVNISTQKLTDTEKILALGEPENLAKMDFVLVDAAGQPVNAENCQFDLMIGEVICPRYKTDANTVSFRYVALDITKAQTEFKVTLKKDGVTICNDSIKVTAEVQGGIVLPDVTVTADTMLKDVTAINTAGEVVTGNISDAVVTETDTQITISRGWLNEDKAFQVGGAAPEVQGIVFNNMPKKANKVQIIPSNFADDYTNFSGMFQNCKALTSIPPINTSKGTNFSDMFYYCILLTEIPQLDVSNSTNCQDMFYHCESLKTIPALNTSKVTKVGYMFYYCSQLTTIEGIDFSSVNHSITNTFYYNPRLTSVKVNGTIAKNIDFSGAPNLDAASCISIAKALVVNTGTLTITFSSTTYNNVLLETIMPDTTTDIKGYIVSKKGWAIKTV